MPLKSPHAAHAMTWRNLIIASAAATIFTLLAILMVTLSTSGAQAAPQMVANDQIRNSKFDFRNPDDLAWHIVPSPTGQDLRDVAMVSATDGWAVGSNATVLRYSGTAWATAPFTPVVAGEPLPDVEMLSATDGFIAGWGDAGGGNIYRWNGTQWNHVYSAPRDINRIDALSPTDVWAAGVGMIFHYDGTGWTISYTQPQGRNIFSIQMVSATEGWAVGATGIILRYNGTTWTEYTPSPAPQTLYDTFFTNASDGWAVGYTDVTYVLRYDGFQWTWAYTPTLQLSRLFFLSSNDGWATSFEGIMHFDGTGFTTVPDPTNEGLNGIYMVSPTDGWIVGTNGTILHYYDDSTPTPTSLPTATYTAVPPTSTATATAAATDTATSTAAPPTSTPCPVQFTDVPQGSTFYDNIRCLACRGIMGGYNDGTFRPNNDITRGQLSKIVANSAGFSEPVTTQSFEDVTPSNSFYLYVERMASRGIIGGYTCGGAAEPCVPPLNRPYFRPNANATRGQISKIVSEAKGYSDPASGQRFEDVPVGSTFYLWIERLASRGIMGGYACGNPEPCVPPLNRPYFRPNANATRGQVSKIDANTFFPGCQTPQGP